MSKNDLKFDFKINKLSDKGAQLMFKNVRCAFVSIAKPAPNLEADKDPKYELTLLIPKKTKHLEKIRKTIADVIADSEKFKKAEERRLALKTSHKIHGDGAVIKDGDKMKNSDGVIYDGLEDHYCVKISTYGKKMPDGTYQPKVKFPIKDRMNEDIELSEQANQLYSGIWCDVSVNMQGYVYLKNRGVVCYLNGVQKLKNDKRLGGHNPFEVRDDVEDDMGAFEGEEY